jgi:hypothetical protein
MTETNYSATLTEALQALAIVEAEYLAELEQDEQLGRVFMTGTMYEDRRQPNVCIMPLERHDTHVIVSHRRKTYKATPVVVDGVERITLPFGTFDAAGLA